MQSPIHWVQQRWSSLTERTKSRVVVLFTVVLLAFSFLSNPSTARRAFFGSSSVSSENAGNNGPAANGRLFFGGAKSSLEENSLLMTSSIASGGPNKKDEAWRGILVLLHGCNHAGRIGPCSLRKSGLFNSPRSVGCFQSRRPAWIGRLGAGTLRIWTRPTTLTSAEC